MTVMVPPKHASAVNGSLQMQLPSTYTLDTESIRLDAYRLLCLFYANEEIARRCDPMERNNDPASILEHKFFGREMTRHLLSIAIGLRVLDDQMRSLPIDDSLRQGYTLARELVDNTHTCFVIERENLRDVCNRIIHAAAVEPEDMERIGDHHTDFWKDLTWSVVEQAKVGGVGPKPEPTKWSHLSGRIHLRGFHRGEAWWRLLDVTTFVVAVCALLNHGIPTPGQP